MADTPKKVKKCELITDACPIVGTVHDLEHAQLLTSLKIESDDDTCPGWCPQCEEVLTCEQAWEQWDIQELCHELSRADLEQALDASLGCAPLPEKQDTVSVTCEVFTNAAELPREITAFLKELDSLVRKTERHLQALQKKVKKQ
ncbi:MAG TPA: hypothetical protein PKL83_02570 [bacterium]|nr:hypothetical protein [bacterium]